MSFCLSLFSRQKCAPCHHRKITTSLFVNKILFVLGKHYVSSLPILSLMPQHLMFIPVQAAWLSPVPPDLLAVRLGAAKPLLLPLIGCAFLYLHICWVCYLLTHLFSHHREQCLEILTLLQKFSNFSRVDNVQGIPDRTWPCCHSTVHWVEGRMARILFHVPAACYLFPGKPWHLLPSDHQHITAHFSNLIPQRGNSSSYFWSSANGLKLLSLLFSTRPSPRAPLFSGSLAHSSKLAWASLQFFMLSQLLPTVADPFCIWMLPGPSAYPCP